MSQLVSTGRACPISGSKQAYLVSEKDRHGKPLRNVISKESGLIFIDPVPFEDTEEFYKTEYRKSYKGVHRPKSKHVYRAGGNALQRYERIKSWVSDNANTLDAGSSSGEFVYLMKSRGFQAHGVEANQPYAQYSQKELGINVSVQPFSEYHTEEEFDLISMFHVLEHLEHPIRDLIHLSKSLKTDGIFIIEVPNILYPNMAFRNKWHSGHLFSFCQETLSALGEAVGLKVIECTSIGDGGNLWGVFRKCKKNNGKTNQVDDTFAEQTLYALHRDSLSYYKNPRNYFKFFTKLVKQTKEISASRKKTAKQILDSLYL